MPDVIANKLDHLLAITSGTEQYLITCTNKKYKFLLTTTLTISVYEICVQHRKVRNMKRTKIDILTTTMTKYYNTYSYSNN